MVTPRQRRWRIGRAFCQRASPSPFSLEDPADTADSYACWTDENADEAAVGWTERVRQDRPFLKEASNASARPGAQHSFRAIEPRESTETGHCGSRPWRSGLGKVVIRNERNRTCRIAMFPHRARRARLVLAHKAEAADDVGGEDRGEAAKSAAWIARPYARLFTVSTPLGRMGRAIG